VGPVVMVVELAAAELAIFFAAVEPGNSARGDSAHSARGVWSGGARGVIPFSFEAFFTGHIC
jgi:hypothetical protein